MAVVLMDGVILAGAGVPPAIPVAPDPGTTVAPAIRFPFTVPPVVALPPALAEAATPLAAGAAATVAPIATLPAVAPPPPEPEPEPSHGSINISKSPIRARDTPSGLRRLEVKIRC